MMSSGDRNPFDNHHNPSSGSFQDAASGFDQSVKFSESMFQRFSPVRVPMEIEERNGGFNDTLRALAILKEIGLKVTEESSILIPNLLSFLIRDDPVVVRQSITTGTSLFCAVLSEMALQLRDSGKVDGWLEEIWSWMLRFKDAIWSMLKPGSTGSKVLAAKFLETCFLLFTSDGNDSEGNEWNFDVSCLAPGHPTLNSAMLKLEAKKILSHFLDILQSAHMTSGSLVITVINCLSSIAMKRQVHYDSILSALLDFDPKFETSMGGHAASIQYAVRIALLGFLRCSHSSMLESRDKLDQVLRAKYGSGIDLSIRQIEKISRSIEPNLRESRMNKVDPTSGQIYASSDHVRTRPLADPGDSFAIISDELPSKRARFGVAELTKLPAKVVSDSQDVNDSLMSFSSNTSSVSSELTPTEQMIVAICALLAEGEKGVQSLELLISQIDADVLADVVIETMKHLPKTPPALSESNGSMPANSQSSLPSASSQSGLTVFSATSGQLAIPSVLASSVMVSAVVSTQASDISSVPNPATDSKRDPRRDPRRLDPRRVAVPVDVSSTQLSSESVNEMQGLLDSSSKFTHPQVLTVTDAPASLISRTEPELSESLIDQVTEQHMLGENLEIINDSVEVDPSLEGQVPSNLMHLPLHSTEQEVTTSLEIGEDEGVDDQLLETDSYLSSVSMTVSSEDVSHNFPVMPLYVDLSNEQKKELCKLAITRLIEDYKQVRALGCSESQLPLLAHLIAQINADDDLVTFFRKHVILDHQHNKGHDLAMHVLYHLHAISVSGSDVHSSSAANSYEKFLVAVAKTFLDFLPASDKSFSRLLGDAPCLTESALKLLEDLCQLRGYENHTKDVCEGDRVTQGLGAVWSLILGRPLYRQVCLDIALKCSVHSHDEVRAKAIRLVANKLFILPYAGENIENFARSMLLSVVDQHVSEMETMHLATSDQITETGSQEVSVSGSLNSELGPSESELVKGALLSPQGIPALSLLHAQQQTSLFFALCTKKPSLLHVVFDVYGRAPKAVRQSIHRHIPGLVRTLGPSYPELLQIISGPPEGSENLIMLVLQLITEESTPPPDLIASVKRLYATKLKDVAILIPMLSSLSKDEVLPIFPRLVDLPLEKFQAALARILQGSAHTGPALTPVEVLVAIHEVDPAKHGVALKKITDACTACFEQRTVFTHQVLAKSLSQMVEQVPLPMLFMRTVIQAIGTFPTLVDFVMGILSKLVSKQIWKMPKLWVGFLKLVSQTHPHSFSVLLQLPPPQLENALNKYGNLRGPLTTYASQPNIRTSLSRQTLQVLGLSDLQQAPTISSTPSATLHTSDTGSSAHGSALS